MKPERQIGDRQIGRPYHPRPGEWGAILDDPDQLVYFGREWARRLRRARLRALGTIKAGRCPCCHRPAPQVGGWRRCPASSASGGRSATPDPIEFQLRKAPDGYLELWYRRQGAGR